jgi:hypothetical protein
MSHIRFTRAEEQVAHQLANIGVQLHQLGLTEPFQHVFDARLALLTILDNEFGQRSRIKGEK